jgi:trimeric autotransporter adhesin
MKKLFIALLCLSFGSKAQNFGFNADGSRPHTSAMMDVKSPSKGMLIPRIALTGSADITTIPTPAVSLMIYNTAAAGSGSTSVSPGFYFWNGSVWKKLLDSALPTASNSWNKNGNSGTDPATDFIGTTDEKSLVFKINNIKAGHFDIVNYNTFLGYYAGEKNTTGARNIGIGEAALSNSLTSLDNLAIGYGAIQNPSYTVDNVAIGNYTLSALTTGVSNIAIGKNTLGSVTTGSNNIGIGTGNLTVNSIGSRNVAIGTNALSQNNTGGNVAIGFQSQFSTTTGANNTSIGNNSNILPGNLNNATSIGNLAQAGCSNCMVLGSVSGVNSATSDVNVGIGTNTPTQPLSFRTGNGGKISFGEGSGSVRYGVGIQNNNLQIYTPTVNGDFAFGFGNSESFTETVRIKNNKRVGIGTNDPLASLDILRTANTTMNVRGSVNISHFNFEDNEDTFIRGGKDGSKVIINDYENSGSVGIGTATPFYKLDVNGVIRCTSLIQSSDARYKTNIQSLFSVSEKLNHINAYTYNWKDAGQNNDLQIGLLAQEVQKVYPELVKADEQGMLAVNYSGLIPVLLQAVKEQQIEINLLKERVKSIK